MNKYYVVEFLLFNDGAELLTVLPCFFVGNTNDIYIQVSFYST